MSQYSRNRHLNLYQFFSNNERNENNLTRSLALCLQNNPLFFKTFLINIVGPDESNILFNHIDEGDFAEINIQVNTANIRDRQDDFEKVIGITLTTTQIELTKWQDYKPTEVPGSKITDVFIQLKNIALIIEAKRTEENCSKQLKEQMEECDISLEKIVLLKSLTWEQVLEMLISTDNIYRLLGGSSLFLRDFIQLIEIHYIDWLPVLPFSQLPFPKNREEQNFSKHYKRLEQVKQEMGVELVEFRDRTSIPINVEWATEVTPYFSKDPDKDILEIYVWPANTKSQGRSLYKKDQSWQGTKSLKVNGNEFKLRIIPEIVFRHFNKFISQITMQEGPSKLHNYDNFTNVSGKKDRKDWPKLEAWFDDNINFDWRSSCQWKDKFLDSDRSYLTVSMGFEVVVEIPYSILEKLDKQKRNTKPVATLFKDIVEALEKLI